MHVKIGNLRKLHVELALHMHIIRNDSSSGSAKRRGGSMQQQVSESALNAAHAIQLRARLIYNPAAWRAERWPQSAGRIRAALQAEGIHVDAVATRSDEHGTHLARAAVAQGYDVVVAAGGDGTVHAVATGLLGSAVPLGIIPLGTANNLAFSLHIPADIAAACAVISEGKQHAIDVGMLNGRPFFEVVSIGTMAALFPQAEASRHQGLGGLLRGAVAVLPRLRHVRRAPFQLTLDGHSARVTAWQITIGNAPYTGLRFALAPDAHIDDGLLDVIIDAQPHWWDIIPRVIALLRGNGAPNRYTIMRHAHQIRVRSRHAVPLTIDGDAYAATPATITVMPGALRVCVPMHPAPRLSATPFALLARSMARPGK
jgi:diacylglycerol kinase (ATP)